jgi:hypothetical protein
MMMAARVRPRAAALCLFVLAAGAYSYSPPWPPARWERVQVQAFPGSSPRFMSPAELAALTRFDMLNVWGLNTTCVQWNGTATYPATCGDGGCRCAAPSGEQQLFATDMNAALQAQSRALKAAANKTLPVVGYIDFPTAQQYFPRQRSLCTNASLAPWRLATAAKGVVDCFALPPQACNHQGMEWCQPDFRIPAAREWWVGAVLGDLIDSPDIDGSFLDECDQLFEMCAWMQCTADELAALKAGTLAAIDAALAAAAAAGKWLVVSVQGGAPADYHAAVVASLLAHQSGFRFYEGFGTVGDMLTMAAEVAAGVPVQAHAYQMTHAPDFVELALFLLSAGPYSYFSYSAGWGFDSFPWLPEFDLPLGAPLGPATAANRTGPPVPPWAPLPGVNLICGMPPAPGTSGNGVAFLGAGFASAAACAAAARANATLTTATWVSPPNSYAGCWAREAALSPECLAEAAAPGGGDCGAPCYASSESDTESFSAAALPGATGVTYTREFEKLSVTVDTNGSAFLTPRA